MLKRLYKRILRHLALSVEQLRELQSRLTPERISTGPFVCGGKNCPNTTALAVKEGRDRFEASGHVRRLLRERGVGSTELWVFYLLFDISAMISRRQFEQSLKKLKEAVNELMHE